MLPIDNPVKMVFHRGGGVFSVVPYSLSYFFPILLTFKSHPTIPFMFSLTFFPSKATFK